MSSEARYEFGAAAEDRSLLLGLRAGQLATLAAALLVGVLVVRTVDGRAAFLVAGLLVAAAAAAALVPLQGRTLEQWAPVAARFATRRLVSRHRYRSPLPWRGHNAAGQAPPAPPPPLAGVELLAAPLETTGAPVGVVCDRRAGTYAAVLAVRGRSFQLADTPHKQRRLSAWGAILAGLARTSSPIHRLQWVERTVPEDGDAMGRYLTEAVTVPRDHPTLASYLDLVDQAGPAAPQHETFLVAAISAAGARRAIKQAGGGDTGATRVLLREVAALARKLAAAELTVEGMLTPRLVAARLRTAFDPTARPGLARRGAAADEPAGTTPENAWPLATETHWATYHTENVCHATYWIAQWPRSPVGPDFLAPLLLGAGGLRTVAVTMQPVSPLRAHRDVEQAVLKGEADEQLRTNAGFATTARRQRARETAARRERELADGHADYRLAGYITVTAPNPDELEAACGEVEQAAQQAFLELRRLYGEQDHAFTATLPLARGLD